jgi:hypothetical protein
VLHLSLGTRAGKASGTVLSRFVDIVANLEGQYKAYVRLSGPVDLNRFVLI